MLGVDPIGIDSPASEPNRSGAITMLLTATLSFAGALSRNAIHMLIAAFTSHAMLSLNVTRHVFASLGPKGTTMRTVSHAIPGALSFVGSITSRRVTRIQTASVNFIGSAQAHLIKLFESRLAFMGAPTHNVRHELYGELTFSGFLKLTEEFVRSLMASISFSGTQSYFVSHALEASLEVGGSLKQFIIHRIEAAISFLGDVIIQHPIIQRLAATLGLNGNLAKSITRALRSTLKFIDNLHFEEESFPSIIYDQLVLTEPLAILIMLAPDTFESELGNVTSKLIEQSPRKKATLIEKRNQVILLTYDLALR